MGTKSIHTLGDPQIEVSRRYAEDEAKLTEVKEYLIQDTLSKGVEIPSYGATFPELQKLFGLQESKLPFAIFPEPPKDFSSVFTLSPSLMPSVGSLAELREAQAKLKIFPTKDKIEEEQKKIILHSLSTLSSLENILATVNAKRNQYGKG